MMRSVAPYSKCFCSDVIEGMISRSLLDVLSSNQCLQEPPPATLFTDEAPNVPTQESAESGTNKASEMPNRASASGSQYFLSIRSCDARLLLTLHQIRLALSYFELSARRVLPMSGGSSLRDETELARLLDEKEKDLELAAKIGQSLLEQNRELQNRNDFLEESLNASNDTIVQLRHDLQMRINLLHVYAEYDDDLSSSGSRERRSNIESLQRRMTKLQNENSNLLHEATNLKKFSAGLEEKEKLHISECARQLDVANEKISRLQSLLAEKNEECAAQGAEVERLLKEVAIRSSREKSLISETADLHEQLNEAIAIHEELSTEFVELQERYTEVMSMLHDAEEELRTFRQNHSGYRTSSADSLYDSLASELEASDCGFYNAISSARSSRQQSCGDSLRLSENVPKLDFEPVKGNGYLIEMPYTERSACDTRSIATATDPPASDRIRHTSRSGEDVVDVPSAVLAEIVRRAKSIEPPTNRLGADDKCDNEVAQNAEEIAGDASSPKPSTPPEPTSESTPLAENPPLIRQLSDAASDKSTQWSTSWLGINEERHRKGSESPNGCLSKATSNDSLACYEGPKLGEPGRPGTRDLDYSMRRLNIRKQVEKEYARFRRQRGLSPFSAPFFPSLSSARKSKESFERLLDSDRTRLFQPWKTVSSVGLLAAVRGSALQGVLTRSTISANPPMTPPSTPFQARRHIAPDNGRGERTVSSGGLVDALGLFLPVNQTARPPQSEISARLQRSESNGGSPAAQLFLLNHFKSGIITRAGLS